jgi:hypothetical protein
MSTIDDAAKYLRETADPRFASIARRHLSDLISYAATREQEIARLKDQLATARELRGLVMNALSIGRHMDSHGLAEPSGIRPIVATLEKVERALVAVPTSDRERLLEEARALVMEAKPAVMYVKDKTVWVDSQQEAEDWIAGADRWLAKLGASNQ